MRKSKLQRLASTTLIALGLSAAAASTAFACWYCHLECDPHFTGDQPQRIDFIVGTIAKPGQEAAVRELVEDAVRAHMLAGEDEETAIQHVEMTFQGL